MTFWKLLVVSSILMISGCGGYLTNWGGDVTKGVTNDLTSDAGVAELSTLTKDLVASARNEALGTETNKQLQVLLTNAGETANVELIKLFVVLKKQLQLMVRESIDQALGDQTLAEIAVAREQLVGEPLRNDLDLAIDEITPQLDQAVQSVVNASAMALKEQADAEVLKVNAEEAKWKSIAVAFVIGSGFLLVGLILGLLLFLSHERSHLKIIEALTAKYQNKAQS